MSWIWAVGSYHWCCVSGDHQFAGKRCDFTADRPVCQYGSDVFVCDGRGCGNPLWCIFDRSDQFHHNGSDYFPDGKRDECAGWSWQKEGAGKTCCENVPLLQKQGCGRGNPLSVLYVYAGNEKRRKETIECTLCDKTVQQSLCIQRPGRMQWMRSSRSLYRRIPFYGSVFGICTPSASI